MSLTSEQRKQIMALITQRRPTAQIAAKLGVSVSVVAGLKAAKTMDYRNRGALAEATAKWAVIMAQVAVRRRSARAPWPRWQFVKFLGRGGGESVGVVDLIAVRKDHGRQPPPGLQPGDALQILLLQVKGGNAAKPTERDGKRLRILKGRYKARSVILATWMKSGDAKFYCLRPRVSADVGWKKDWKEATDTELANVFV